MEECEDQNTDDSDGCDSSCAIEEGFELNEHTVDGGGLDLTVLDPICGDSMVV